MYGEPRTWCSKENEWWSFGDDGECGLCVRAKWMSFNVNSTLFQKCLFHCKVSECLHQMRRQPTGMLPVFSVGFHLLIISGLHQNEDEFTRSELTEYQQNEQTGKIAEMNIDHQAQNSISNGESYPIYFHSDMTSFRDLIGPVLKIRQIDNNSVSNSSHNDFFAIQRQSAAPNWDTAQKELERDGYCVITVQALGFESHQHLYQTAKENISEIARRMNQHLFTENPVQIRDRALSRIYHNTGTPNGNLHRDGDLWKERESFALWIPAVSNKYLAVIPLSSFHNPVSAVVFLESPDRILQKTHLERFARIPDSGTLIVFKSLSRIKNYTACIHGGIRDKFMKEQRLIYDVKDPLSVIVDLHVVQR